MQATVSCGLSQVSVTARMSIVLEINKSLSDAVLSRIDRTFVVANRMLRLTAGPGFRLTSPASSRIIANLNVGVERGIGSNLRLKQRLRHGKLCKKDKECCILVGWGNVEMTADRWRVSGLHRAKSPSLEATEHDKNKTHKRNSGDIVLMIVYCPQMMKNV